MSSNKTWISQQNNLNVMMKLYPEVPIIDQKTKISFQYAIIWYGFEYHSRLSRI
ncbi:MAG: hypothetical protein H0X50_08795 [Nitrosopumilus sp.]|nr:hypothetical protein [Nitrosopumilus sp.]